VAFSFFRVRTSPRFQQESYKSNEPKVLKPSLSPAV
jgi:hypothetical protein